MGDELVVKTTTAQGICESVAVGTVISVVRFPLASVTPLVITVYPPVCGPMATLTGALGGKFRAFTCSLRTGYEHWTKPANGNRGCVTGASLWQSNNGSQYLPGSWRLSGGHCLPAGGQGLHRVAVVNIDLLTRVNAVHIDHLRVHLSESSERGIAMQQRFGKAYRQTGRCMDRCSRQ